jgi:hypothetical protein
MRTVDDADNRAGAAAAFSIATPLRRGWASWLLVLLMASRWIRFLSEPMRRLSFIYFAQWSVLSRLPGDDHEERLARPTLYFQSNFNTAFDEYISTFVHSVPWRIRFIWWGAMGRPHLFPFSRYMAWTRSSSLAHQHYYGAYTEATTTDVARAMACQEAVRPLVEATQSRDLDAFDAAWRDFLGRLQPLWTRSAPAPETSVWEYGRVGNDHATIGTITTLTTATPIAAEADAGEVARRIRALDRDASPFSASPSTHFARLLVTDAFGAEEPPVSRMPLTRAYVIFGSTFDGEDLEPYVRELVASAPDALEAAWSDCVGYPGPEVSALAAWLERHRLPTQLCFATAPRATVAEVRAALDRHRRLVEFVIARDGSRPRELRDEFCAAFPDLIGRR